MRLSCGLDASPSVPISTDTPAPRKLEYKAVQNHDKQEETPMAVEQTVEPTVAVDEASPVALRAPCITAHHHV